MTASFTGRVTAVTVDADVGETLEFIVAGLAIDLLRQTVVAVAVVVFVAMRLQRAVATAGNRIGTADVGLTLGEALVDAETGTIAEVRCVLDCAFAELSETDRTVHPETTSAGTVASTILLAVARIQHLAVTEGIVPYEHRGTAAVAVTHGAEPTFSLRVRPVVVAGAGPFAICQSTTLAGIVAGILTAVSVNAVVGETLELVGAGLAIHLLRQTGLALTVVVRLTVSLYFTREEAVGTVGVAHIGFTVNVRQVDAFTDPVAEVLEVFEVPRAGLWDARRDFAPEGTGIGPVAGSVESTGRLL